MKTKFLIILFITFCFNLSSQVILEHLTKKDGLPSNYTSGIIQDNDGYIWIATPKGAVRYDGKTMKTYTVDDGLTTNEVVGFFKDGIGRIWFNCFGGKACYYYKGKVFNRFNDNKLAGFNLNFSIVIDLDKSAFMDVEYYPDRDTIVYIYNKVDLNTLIKISSKKILRPKLIEQNLSLMKDDFLHKTEGILKLDNFFPSDFKFNNRVYYYGKYIGFLSKQDTIYIINWQENFLYKKFHVGYELNSFAVDKFGKIVLCSSKEILSWNDRRLKIDSFYTNIRGIYSDNSNNLWISTDNGIFKCKITYNKFNLKRPIYIIKKFDKDVYAGLDKMQHLIVAGKTKNSIYANPVDGRTLDMLKLRKNIYKATDHGLVNISIDETLNVSKTQPGINYKNLAKKSDNEFYSSVGVAGVFLSEIKGKTILSKRLYSKRAFNVFYRKNKQLLASTVDGLLLWKKDTLPYQKIKLPVSNIEVVNHINEDKKERLIFSTNNGLIIESNKNYYIVDKSKGLLDNHINKTFTSEDGKRLYVCTNKGFNVVDYSIDDKKLYYKIKSYTTSDGLPSEEVNCAYEDGDKIYVGTMEGLLTIPVKDTIEPFTIPIRLESLLVNDSSLELKNRKWDHHQNTFQFNFSAFYYQRNREMQFSYQLTTIDQAPVISDNPSIIYRGLAPGNYTLKVFAFDKHYPKLRKSKVWTYRFTISPPYYKTWWFISMITLLAVSGGFLVYISYMRRKQKQNLEVQTLLKKMAQHRLEALKGQMNPHFIFNSLNTVQHFISSHHEREAMDFIAKFSSLIRKMLDLARVDKLSLEKEIQFLKDYAEIEQIRYSHKFDVDFIVEVDELDDIELPSMLVQPLLENAIKHGVSNLKERRGRIEVVIMTVDEHWLNIKIKDNGNGLVKREESSKSYTSAALDIIRERLTVYEVEGRKGRLDIQFSENGTVSELVVPI